eukprot:gene2541-3339_t
MHVLGIPRVMQFPFPTAPPAGAIARANALLRNIGAVKYGGSGSGSSGDDDMGALTRLGSQLARIPI